MPATQKERIEAIEKRVDELERQFTDLLRVMSRKRLTPLQLRALRRKTVAFARSEKKVGSGKDAVLTQETKIKLKRDLEDT